jgi:hypothetical protein
MCFFLQDGLKTLVPSRFENLLQHGQKSRYLQRKIKPFEVILQEKTRISAQYQIEAMPMRQQEMQQRGRK